VYTFPELSISASDDDYTDDYDAGGYGVELLLSVTDLTTYTKHFSNRGYILIFPDVK
jgi:hypothetical protein